MREWIRLGVLVGIGTFAFRYGHYLAPIATSRVTTWYFDAASPAGVSGATIAIKVGPAGSATTFVRVDAQAAA